MKPIVAQNKNKISNKICILHVWTHLLVILFLCLLKTFLLGDTHRKKRFWSYITCSGDNHMWPRSIA